LNSHDDLPENRFPKISKAKDQVKSEQKGEPKPSFIIVSKSQPAVTALPLY